MLNINDSNSSLERDENSVFKQTGLPKIITPGADLYDSIEATRDRTEDSVDEDGHPPGSQKILVQNSMNEATMKQ